MGKATSFNWTRLAEPSWGHSREPGSPPRGGKKKTTSQNVEVAIPQTLTKKNKTKKTKPAGYLTRGRPVSASISTPMLNINVPFFGSVRKVFFGWHLGLRLAYGALSSLYNAWLRLDLDWWSKTDGGMDERIERYK